MNFRKRRPSEEELHHGHSPHSAHPSSHSKRHGSQSPDDGRPPRHKRAATATDNVSVTSPRPDGQSREHFSSNADEPPSLPYPPDSQESLDALILAFQKDAVLRKLRGLARKAETLRHEKEVVVKQNKDLAESLLAIFDELLRLSSRFKLDDDVGKLLSKEDSARLSFFNALLDCEKVDQLEDHLNEAHEQASRVVASLIQYVESHVAANQSFAASGKVDEELKARYIKLRHQVVNLEKAMVVARNEAAKLRETLTTKEGDVERLQRTVERLQSRTWQVTFQQQPTSDSPSVGHAGDARSGSIDAGAPEPSAIPTGNLLRPEDLEALAVTERVQELKSLTEELTRVRRDRDILQVKLAAGPDEAAVMAHPASRHMRDDYAARTRECSHLRQRISDLQADASRMKDSLMTMERATREEKDKLEQRAEEDLRKVSDELARIRKQRDEYLTVREQLSNERAARGQSEDELRSQVSMKEERIATLQSQITRLQSQMLVTVDLPYVAKELRVDTDLLKSLNAKIADLETKLHRTQNGASTAKDGEAKPSEANSSSQGPSPDFAKLQVQLEVAKTQVEMLTTEMNSMAEGYAQLDKAVSAHADTIREKNAQIEKLVNEKTRLDGKILMMRKQVEQHKNESEAARRSLDMQRDSLRSVEERERGILGRCHSHQRDLQAANETVLNLQNKSVDLERMLGEAQVALQNAEALSAAHAQTLESRTGDLEHALHERGRFAERVAQLQALVDERDKVIADLQKRVLGDHSSGNGAGSASGGNESELLAQYRQLLMCTTCKTRFKDTALVRCMHTFCRTCINERLETRQRKCPTCGDGFGQNDVRTIYM